MIPSLPTAVIVSLVYHLFAPLLGPLRFGVPLDPSIPDSLAQPNFPNYSLLCLLPSSQLLVGFRDFPKLILIFTHLRHTTSQHDRKASLAFIAFYLDNLESCAQIPGSNLTFFLPSFHSFRTHSPFLKNYYRVYVEYQNTINSALTIIE